MAFSIAGCHWRWQRPWGPSDAGLPSPPETVDVDGVRPQRCVPSVRVESSLTTAIQDRGFVPAGRAHEGELVDVIGRARRVAVDAECQVRAETLPSRVLLRHRSQDQLWVDATSALSSSRRTSKHEPGPSSWSSSSEPPLTFRVSPGQYRLTISWAKLAAQLIDVIDHRPCADRWINVGPEVNTADCEKAGTCFTGRVMGIAFDPDQANRMYVGTRGGGVWRSDDGAENWYPTTDHKNLPGALAVGRVAVAPARPGETIGRVFAGTGDPHNDWFGFRSSDGLYLSVNGGASWRKPQCGGTTDPPTGIVSRIIVDPDDAATVYAATRAGVYVSTDGGECWRNITANLSTFGSTSVFDLARISRQGTPTLYAGISPSSQRICSAVVAMANPTQANAAWDVSDRSPLAIPPGFLCPGLPGSLARLGLASVRDSQGDTIFAVVVTTDRPEGHVSVFEDSIDLRGRRVWTRRTDPTDNGCAVPGGGQGCGAQCLYLAISIAADPGNACAVVVATQFGLMRSDDCGVHWQKWDPQAPGGLHADQHMLAYHPTNGVLYLGSDGGLAAVNMRIQPPPTQGCHAQQPMALDCSVPLNCWTNRNNGFATDQLYNLAVSNAWDFEAGTTGDLQDNGTKARLSDSDNWDWRSTGGGDGGTSALDSDDRDVAYVKAYFWGSGNANRLGDLFSTGGTGISDSGSIGNVEALWNDRYEPAFLLARLDDGQLYYADDTRTVAPGQNASWRCLDPTPGDKTDVVSSVEGIRGSGQYLVAADGPGDAGAVYLVNNLGTGNAPGACSSASNANATVVIDPSANRGRLNAIAADPARDDYSFYATLIPANGQPNSMRVIHAVNDAPGTWTVTGIAPTAAFLAATPNAWNMETPWKNIAADPVLPHTVYVNTDNGLMIGERQGNDDSTWTWRQSSGVPQTYVTGLSVRHSPVNAIVRASTYGRSVWEHAADMCDSTSHVIKRPDPIIKVPIPRPDPVRRRDSLSVPVAFRYDGRAGEEAVLRVVPTIHGRVSPGFISERVRIRRGFTVSLAGVVYAGATAEPSIVTDGLFVQVASLRGDPIATSRTPTVLAWRRPDARSLWVSADVTRDGEAIHPSLPIRIQATGGKEAGRVAHTPETVTLAAGTEAVVSAPPTIRVGEGAARFRAWDYTIEDDPLEPSRERSIVPGRGTVLRVRMASDAVLVAHYELLHRPTEREPLRHFPPLADP
jgi:hypothetical protein